MGNDGFDKVENKTDEWTGAAKEKIGQATDDEHLEAEGKFDKTKAKAKQSVQDAKDDLEDAGRAAVQRVKNAFDR